MARYVVKDGEIVKRNGRDYPEGKVLDLTTEEAEAIPWAVEPAPAAKKAPAKKKTAKKATTKKK